MRYQLLNKGVPACECGKSEWVTTNYRKVSSIIKCLACGKSTRTRCEARHEIPMEGEGE